MQLEIRERKKKILYCRSLSITERYYTAGVAKPSCYCIMHSICVFIQQIFSPAFYFIYVLRPSLFTWLHYLTFIFSFFSLIPPVLLPDILITIYSIALCLTFTSSGFCCRLSAKQVYLLLISSICSPSSFIWAKCSRCWSVCSHPSPASFSLCSLLFPDYFPKGLMLSLLCMFEFGSCCCFCMAWT